MEKYLRISESESERKTFKINHNSTACVIELVKTEDGEQETMWFDYYTFSELSKFIMELNKQI